MGISKKIYQIFFFNADEISMEIERYYYYCFRDRFERTADFDFFTGIFHNILFAFSSRKSKVIEIEALSLSIDNQHFRVIEMQKRKK